jgi:gentisate 1,2-dioxygenase
MAQDMIPTGIGSAAANWKLHRTSLRRTQRSTSGLAAVALINPGMQIHPPHQHVEEEYLMVTEGTGVWSLHGEERAAKAGDMLYASPWDWHGITNTGTEPMTFVVWKFNGKNIDLPAAPEDER